MIISQATVNAQVNSAEKQKDNCPTCGKRRSYKHSQRVNQRNKAPVVREPLKLATVGAIGGTNPYPQHQYPSHFAKQNQVIRQKQYQQRDITNDEGLRRFLAKEAGSNQREL